MAVREGRRKGARAWQDHFVEILLGKECPGSFLRSWKSPTIFHSKDLDITMDVHVDDGYVTGPDEGMLKLFGYLTGKIVLKLSPLIKKGMSFEHVGAYRLLTGDDIWVQSLPKYQESVLKMMDMENCKPSISPKLDKATRKDTSTKTMRGKELCTYQQS